MPKLYDSKNLNKEFIDFIGEQLKGKPQGMYNICLMNDSYTPDNGGIRPVEFCVDKGSDYLNINSYAYYTHDGAGELEICDEFDLVQGVCQLDGTIELSLYDDEDDALGVLNSDLFSLYQYHKMGLFNRIAIGLNDNAHSLKYL